MNAISTHQATQALPRGLKEKRAYLSGQRIHVYVFIFLLDEAQLWDGLSEDVVDTIVKFLVEIDNKGKAYFRNNDGILVHFNVSDFVPLAQELTTRLRQ